MSLMCLYETLGCADPWDMKALRGGNGGQFYVPMATNIQLESLAHVLLLRQAAQEEDISRDDSNNNIPASSPRAGIGIFLADSGCGSDKFGLPIGKYTSFDYGKFSRVARQPV